MDIRAKIAHMRNLINGKKEDKCPTAVLFYIANSRQCPDTYSVEPWYSKIKSLSGNATKYYGDFHKAVIFGMYPELEDACKYFEKSINSAIKSDPKLSTKVMKKIEQDTIKNFNLPNQYSINTPTDAQQKQIDIQIAKIYSNFVDTEINSYNPATQALAKSLKHSQPKNVQSQSELLGHFHLLDMLSQNEEVFNRIKSKYPADVVHNTEQLYSLKHQGVVDDKYNIKDYKKFKQSSLVQNFVYEKQTYNLEKNLMSAAETLNLKAQDPWDRY